MQLGSRRVMWVCLLTRHTEASQEAHVLSLGFDSRWGSGGCQTVLWSCRTCKRRTERTFAWAGGGEPLEAEQTVWSHLQTEKNQVVNSFLVEYFYVVTLTRSASAFHISRSFALILLLNWANPATGRKRLHCNVCLGRVCGWGGRVGGHSWCWTWNIMSLHNVHGFRAVMCAFLTTWPWRGRPEQNHKTEPSPWLPLTLYYPLVFLHPSSLVLWSSQHC